MQERISGKPQRSRTALVMAGLLTALLLGFGAWSLASEPSVASARLPNGERLSLVAATDGPLYLVPFGSRLMYGLRRFPPTARFIGLPSTAFGQGSGPNTWFRGPSAPSGSNPWDAYVEDLHGCRFRGYDSQEQPSPGQEPGTWIMSPRNWPRRDPQLTHVVRYVGGWEPHGWNREQGKGNPSPGPTQAEVRGSVVARNLVEYPVWTAEPYPVRRRQRRLDVQLLSLLPLPPGRMPHWQPNGRLARFQFLGTGPGAQNWKVLHCVVYDATTNFQGCLAPLSSLPNELELPGFCDREAAWQLDVAFERLDLSTAPPDYRLRLSRKELEQVRHLNGEKALYRTIDKHTFEIRWLRNSARGPAVSVALLEPFNFEGEYCWSARARPFQHKEGRDHYGKDYQWVLAGHAPDSNDGFQWPDAQNPGLPHPDGVEVLLFRGEKVTFRVKP